MCFWIPSGPIQVRKDEVLLEFSPSPLSLTIRREPYGQRNVLFCTLFYIKIILIILKTVLYVLESLPRPCVLGGLAETKRSPRAATLDIATETAAIAQYHVRFLATSECQLYKSGS